MSATEPLSGGGLTAAKRVGSTVHRVTGPWTPAVHALLRHLERVGFEAPRVIGIDEEGREVLTYVAGRASGWKLTPSSFLLTSRNDSVLAHPC